MHRGCRPPPCRRPSRWGWGRWPRAHEVAACVPQALAQARAPCAVPLVPRGRRRTRGLLRGGTRLGLAPPSRRAARPSRRVVRRVAAGAPQSRAGGSQPPPACGGARGRLPRARRRARGGQRGRGSRDGGRGRLRRPPSRAHDGPGTAWLVAPVARAAGGEASPFWPPRGSLSLGVGRALLPSWGRPRRRGLWGWALDGCWGRRRPRWAGCIRSRGSSPLPLPA